MTTVGARPGQRPGADASVRPDLVGRAGELARLASMVSAPPAVAAVEGEAGIGKTRLVAELREHPDCAARRFVAGCAGTVQEPFPLGPLLEAVRGCGVDLTGAKLSPVVGALGPLLPELAPVLPPSLEPLTDPASQRHRVFRGLQELLAALCPAVVVLEDLHWADAQTVEFLQYLVGSPPEGLSLLVTFRPEEVDSGVRALAGRLPAGVGREYVTLAPLDVPQTGELAATLVGVDRVSTEFAGYLRDRTGGLPFAVEEVMALLRERGDLTPVRGGWQRRVLAELAVPAAVRDHVLARAELLPADTRTLLETVAVLEDPAPEWLIAAVADSEPERLAARLRPAIRAGVLLDDGALVGFRHVLAAQAVYDEIVGPDRRGLHARAAAVLRDRDPDQRGRIAHHLRHAGRLTEWATAAEQAADQASALHHEEEAAWQLEAALRHAPLDDATAGRLAVKLGWAALAVVRPPEVDDLLSTVLEQDLPAPVHAELQLVLGALLDRTDTGSPRVRELYRTAAESTDDPNLKAWATIGDMLRRPPGATFEQWQESVSLGVALMAGVTDPEFQVTLRGKLALILTALGDPRWREWAMPAGPESAPSARRFVNAYHSAGSAACDIGSYWEADRLLNAALDGALSCEDQRLAAISRGDLATLDFCRGRWEDLPESIPLLTEQLVDQTPSQRRVTVVAGNLALARGELTSARRTLSEAMTAHLHHDGADLILPATVTPLLRLALGRGDQPLASTVDAHLAAQGPLPVWPAGFRSLPTLVEALSALDRAGEARALIARYETELAGREAPLAPAALPHARGLLALAEDVPDRAAELLLSAAAQYERLPSPYEAAQARERAADAFAAAGRTADAATPLRSAMDAYAQLGASWDLTRAARAARQYGVPGPAPHRGGPRGYGDELSPRERAVAELAATGKSNQEIAEELFVSLETVKTHLRSVLRKLGVRTRAAIAHRLTRS